MKNKIFLNCLAVPVISCVLGFSACGGELCVVKDSVSLSVELSALEDSSVILTRNPTGDLLTVKDEFSVTLPPKHKIKSYIVGDSGENMFFVVMKKGFSRNGWRYAYVFKLSRTPMGWKGEVFLSSKGLTKTRLTETWIENLVAIDEKNDLVTFLVASYKIVIDTTSGKAIRRVMRRNEDWSIRKAVRSEENPEISKEK